MKKIIFLSLAFAIMALAGIFSIPGAAVPENGRELFHPEFPVVINPAVFISEILTVHFQK